MPTRASFFLYSFFLALLGDLIFVAIGQHELRQVSKPLIILFLLGYFIISLNTTPSSLKKWMILALAFSWTGDVLLLFDKEDPLFFILGLSSFLIAHIFYIIFFNRVRMTERVRGKPGLLLIVIVYYAILIYLLSPFLFDLKIPVRVYAVVICFMFMLGMHMLYISNRKSGLLLMLGSLLFVLSDSILAINKFYYSFAAADILVMLTYGAAQLMIAEGAIRYIRPNSLS